MRELAVEAPVSFATPFIHFGRKAAIMHALSAHRIHKMAERFGHARQDGDATHRVFVAVEIASGVMLEDPKVDRAVIVMPGTPGQVHARSRAPSAQAIGKDDGFDAHVVDHASSVLRGQLAVASHGVFVVLDDG